MRNYIIYANVHLWIFKGRIIFPFFILTSARAIDHCLHEFCIRHHNVLDECEIKSFIADIYQDLFSIFDIILEMLQLALFCIRC
jgi:hypothetical protein